jgi:uncharacterized protein (TIGR02001 family)
MIKSRIAAGAALLAVAGVAGAGSFSVTPTITNDYDFRGVTQTDEDPAFQLGGSYSFDSGFYLGAWGSNVDFSGNDSGLEVDYFGGYAGSTNSFGYDVGLNYYSYSGFTGASDFNTLELYAGISKEWLSGKLSLTDDAASTGDSAFYLESNAVYPLPQNFSLIGHVGYGFGDAFDEEVLDFGVGVGYSFSNLNLTAKFIDTDAPGSDGRFVASISTTFPWGE